MNGKLILATLGVVGLASTSFGAAFTAGDIAVYAAGPGTGTAGVPANTATNVSIIELAPTTLNATPVQSIDVSGSASPLYTSGSASSTGYLASSNDGSELTFTGHTSAAAAATNENTITGRGVGVVAINTGVYSLATTYTGSSGNQARSATTIDNTNFAIGDQGGIYTNGATSSSPSGNVRAVKSFGGTFYVNQASATTTAIAVNTLSATSGGTLSGLPGLTNLSTIQDFYLVKSGASSAYDTLYYATTAGINKYSFNGTTWSAQGTLAVAGGFFGIAAKELANNAGVALYLTTGSGGASNSVVSYIDSAAYNSTLALGAATTLYTSTNGTVLKGIEVAVPEPATLAAVGLSGMTLLCRRRKSI